MRATLSAFIRIVPIPILIVCFVLFGVLSLAPINGGTLAFLGLPYHPEEVAINYILLEKWLLIYCVPLLVNGFLLEQFKQVELFSILRMKRTKTLRTAIFAVCAMVTVIWSAFIGVGSLLFLPATDAIAVFFVLGANLLLWLSVQFLAFYICNKQAWSGVFVLCALIGMTLLGEYQPSVSHLFPSTWGMATRSTIVVSAGIRPIFMILASIGCTAIFGYFSTRLKGKE